jgi:hypothetical protein
LSQCEILKTKARERRGENLRNLIVEYLASHDRYKDQMDTDARINALENWKTEMASSMMETQTSLIESAKTSQEEASRVSQDYTASIKLLSENYLEALKIQANSLSIPLLRDILMPLMMKLFTFFSILVLLLLGGVLGIKWAFGDILSKIG